MLDKVCKKTALFCYLFITKYNQLYAINQGPGTLTQVQIRSIRRKELPFTNKNTRNYKRYDQINR